MRSDLKHKWRSDCPLSIALEQLGDRWSFLILRDLMMRGLKAFKDFRDSGEGIATNVLSDRLRKLENHGFICSEPEKNDGRKVNYRLTEKGIDLAPVVLELLLWSARNHDTIIPKAMAEEMAQNRHNVLEEVRRRWREHDQTSMLPEEIEGHLSPTLHRRRAAS